MHLKSRNRYIRMSLQGKERPRAGTSRPWGKDHVSPGGASPGDRQGPSPPGRRALLPRSIPPSSPCRAPRVPARAALACTARRNGGIGRRGGFKIRCPQGLQGSSPCSGTTAREAPAGGGAVAFGRMPGEPLRWARPQPRRTRPGPPPPLRPGRRFPPRAALRGTGAPGRPRGTWSGGSRGNPTSCPRASGSPSPASGRRASTWRVGSARA